MKRRRVIIGLIMLALVAVVAALFCPRGRHPCRATFEQVLEGMTREEVAATVGGTPGDYTGQGATLTCNDMSITEFWVAADGNLVVRYRSDGRVDSAYVSELTDRSWRAKLLDRLGF